MRLAVSAGGGRPRTWPTSRCCSATSSFSAAGSRGTARLHGCAAVAARLPGRNGRTRTSRRGERRSGRAAARLRRRRAAAADLARSACSRRSSGPRPSRGRPAAARHVRAQQRLYRGRPLPDAEAVLVEADHGSPAGPWSSAGASGTGGAERALPDALGWALTRAGRPGRPATVARRALHGLTRRALPAARRGSGREAGGLRDAAALGATMGAAGAPSASAAEEARPDGPRRRCFHGGKRRKAPASGWLLASPPSFWCSSARRRPAPIRSATSRSTTSTVSDLGRPRGRPLRARPGRDPTVQEQERLPRRGARRKQDEVERRLVLLVDGRRVELRRPGAAADLPRRRGRLETTRPRAAAASRRRGPAPVELRDGTFPGRIGWKAVVSAPGEGTAVRTSAPSGDPTNGLRGYPEDLLSSPLDRRDAPLPRRARRRHPDRPAGREAGGVAETRRVGRLRRPVRGRRLRRGRAAGAAPGRVRLGCSARALAGPRQGDGRRLPGRHPRHAPARDRAGRHGHGHPHDRRVRARGGHARAVAIRAAGGPLSLADAGLGAAGRGGRRRRARPRTRAMRAHHAHATRTRTTTTTTTTRHDLSWKGLLGMGTAAGLIPLPVGSRRPAGRDLPARGGPRAAADHGLQPGPRATLTTRPDRRLGPQMDPARLAAGRLAAVLPAASALLIVGVGCVLTVRAVPGVV